MKMIIKKYYFSEVEYYKNKIEELKDWLNLTFKKRNSTKLPV